MSRRKLDKVGLISIHMAMHIISRMVEQVWQTCDCLANITANMLRMPHETHNKQSYSKPSSLSSTQTRAGTITSLLLNVNPQQKEAYHHIGTTCSFTIC